MEIFYSADSERLPVDVMSDSQDYFMQNIGDCDHYEKDDESDHVFIVNECEFLENELSE